LAPRDGGAVF